MKDITIETPRLVLRKFVVGDAKSCYENYGRDSSLGKYLPMYPLQDVKSMEAMIDCYIKSYEGESYIWLILEKETQTPIGSASVDVPYKELGIGEVAYLLGENHQGKGYAREAVRAIMEYMFDLEHLYMLEAKYNCTNTASGKLLKKLGFQVDGELRDRRINLENGERNNLMVCSILAKEWVSVV